MQKEKSDCPTEVWLSAKICLPDGKRGFAVGKLIEERDRTINLLLSLDQTLIGSKQEQILGVSKWNSFLLSSQENLANLPKGTAILLAPPRLFGAKFWIARIGEAINSGKDENNATSITYSLLELKRLKNFLEARTTPRIVFRTPVLLVDPKTYTVTQFYTHDISHNGLSLSIEPASNIEENFELNENYLFQLQLHESLTMPALNYKCVHVREDILTGAKLIGFALNDRKAKDPDVEYNLTLLAWSDISEPEGKG
jgi:PilZ domain